MKNNDFEEIFNDLNFDIEEPHSGHRERFVQKLQKDSEIPENKHWSTRKLWRPFLAVAAVMLIAVMVLGETILPPVTNQNADLAGISPEMKQTQQFYTSLITKELNAIEAEKSPETEAIVNDAMDQMKKLEGEYQQLRIDLRKSGNDNRVIYAMIQNFQQRIDLLKNVLDHIENIKTLKNQKHENNII